MTETIRPARLSTPPLARTIEVLAGDLLCTRASNLLEIIGPSNSEAVIELRNAISTYSEVRVGTALARGAAAILEHVESTRDDEAPDTIRCPGVSAVNTESEEVVS